MLGGEESEDKFERRKLRSKVARYTLINDELYTHSFVLPYRNCLNKAKAKYALNEVYKNVFRKHLMAKTITHKLLPGGYYWPTMKKDATKLV